MFFLFQKNKHIIYYYKHVKKNCMFKKNIIYIIYTCKKTAQVGGVKALGDASTNNVKYFLRAP